MRIGKTVCIFRSARRAIEVRKLNIVPTRLRLNREFSRKKEEERLYGRKIQKNVEHDVATRSRLNVIEASPKRIFLCLYIYIYTRLCFVNRGVWKKNVDKPRLSAHLFSGRMPDPDYSSLMDSSNHIIIRITSSPI